MKELSIEEKAKAYDEARKKIAIRFGSNVADEIFSQFEMSEDERIRKELLNYLYDVHDDDEERARWIAYLEKQGEQKPAEWTSRDDYMLNSIADTLDCIDIRINTEGEHEDHSEERVWLLELKDRVQPKPAWSEEDCNQIESIACHLDNIDNEGMAEVLRNIRDKYYHIVPQSTWRPSDEQLKALMDSAQELYACKDKNLLLDLYEQLKAL